MMGGKPWKPDKKCPFFSVDLLQALEANSGGSEGCSAPLLGVTSYGVSMTTLEEVFLQLEDTNQETEGETDESQSFEVSTFRNFVRKFFLITISFLFKSHFSKKPAFHEH